ncbi:MAG: SGNH/GDSL hydrolase family protein [Planctomycetota bacterium]
MIVDRLLPVVGVPLDRPSRLTLPPNLRTPVEQIEYRCELRTNSRGLRGPERRLRKPLSVRRLVLLGDERTFGRGVSAEDTFAARLDARRENVQVINCGQPGANTLRQARILHYVGLDYDPDLVVVCVSADDVTDMPTTPIAEAFPLAPERPGVAGRFWPNLAAHRAAAGQRRRFAEPRPETDFAARTVETAEKKGIAPARIEVWRERMEELPRLVRAACEHRFDGSVLASGLLWRHCWPHRLNLDANWTESRWRSLRTALRTIRDEASRRGAATVIVFLPAPAQYDARRFVFLKSLGYELPAYIHDERSRFQAELSRWCGDRGISFLDLTPVFRAHDDPAALSHRYSGCLTAAGHALIAEELAARLPE